MECSASENGALLSPDYHCKKFNINEKCSRFFSLQALDLHCQDQSFHPKTTTPRHRRGSLSNDGTETAINLCLEKSRSDTLFDSKSKSKSKIQNLNWTKTLADIYNKYDRACAVTRQQGAKKTTFLLQRKISTELKVKQLETVLHPSEKKKVSHNQLGSELPISPTRAKKKVNELKCHLKDIEVNLQAATQEEKDAIQDQEAAKSKQLSVVYLLEAATEDLLQPSQEFCTPLKKPLPKIVVSRMDSVAAMPRKQGTPATSTEQLASSSTNSTPKLPHDGGKGPKSHRRAALDRLKNLSTAMELRGWSFRNPNKSKSKKDGGDPAMDIDRSPLPSRAASVRRPRTDSESGTTAAPPHVGRSIYGNRFHDRSAEPEVCSVASSSDDDGQHVVQTEISQKALNEIWAFEKLIADHFALCKNYDFPYIDD